MGAPRHRLKESIHVNRSRSSDVRSSAPECCTPLGDVALHGQEVKPRPTTKLDPALLDAYVFLALPVYLFGLAFLTDCIEKGVYAPVGHTGVGLCYGVRPSGHIGRGVSDFRALTLRLARACRWDRSTQRAGLCHNCTNVCGEGPKRPAGRLAPVNP